jgi:hypothetical protein
MKITTTELTCDNCKKDLLELVNFNTPSYISLSYSNKHCDISYLGYTPKYKDFCDKKCLKEWLNNENI